MVTKPIHQYTAFSQPSYSPMEQLKAASIAHQPPLIAMQHLVKSPDNYTSNREGFVLRNDSGQNNVRTSVNFRAFYQNDRTFCEMSGQFDQTKFSACART